MKTGVQVHLDRRRVIRFTPESCERLTKETGHTLQELGEAGENGDHGGAVLALWTGLIDDDPKLTPERLVEILPRDPKALRKLFNSAGKAAARANRHYLREFPRARRRRR